MFFYGRQNYLKERLNVVNVMIYHTGTHINHTGFRIDCIWKTSVLLEFGQYS